MMRRRLTALLGTVLLVGCADSASPTPTPTKKLLKDPPGYDNGWRDAGFRKDPADKTNLNYQWGWWPAEELEAYGDALFIFSPGDGAGGGLYRHLAGTTRFEFLPLPNGEKVGDILRGASGLLVWSSQERLWILDPVTLKWDSIPKPAPPEGELGFGSTANAGDTVFFQGYRLHECVNGICDSMGSGRIYRMDARIGRMEEMLSTDTTLKAWGVRGVVDDWIIADFVIGYGNGLGYWDRSSSRWLEMPGSALAARKGLGVGGALNGYASYRGKIYAGTYTHANTYQNGVWDTLSYPGVELDGTKRFRWGWFWGFKNIRDTIYGYGSTVRRLNPQTGVFEEIAGNFESGDIPPGSTFAQHNKGCFYMGDVKSIAKIGDTIYAATATGLWKIGVSRAVVCAPNYNGDDTCGHVAKLEQCITDPQVYCCDYEHAGFAPCDKIQCPAARSLGSPNPLAVIPSAGR